MRIGIDVREFRRDVYTGLRTILKDILSYLTAGPEDEIVLFGNQFTDLDDIPVEFRAVIIKERNTFIWDQVQLPLALKKNKTDVFFSPYIKTPVWRVCPYISTICDIIPLKISKYTGIMAVLEKAYFYIYAMVSGRRASKVITLSENARCDVNRVFGIDKNTIEVTYPSVDITCNEDGDRSGGVNDMTAPAGGFPYILYVGNFKKHKNVKRLIEGYERLPDKIRSGYRLVLAGGAGKEKDIIERYIAGKGLDGNVVTISNISHADVLSVIKNASVFVFPSLAEGFGIPPVEAMALGVPVASSCMEPMKEVLGDAAVFFDPYDPGDIARAVIGILSDEDIRSECVRKGYERAAIFDARKLSARVMDVIRFAGEEKTVCISSEFPPVIGGISSQVYNLWKRLDRSKVLVLTSSPENDDRSVDAEFHIVRKRYPLGRGLFPRIFRTIAVILNVRKYNRVFNVKYNHCAQVLSAGLAGLLMRTLRGVPYVVYVYSADILEFGKNRLTGYLLRKILHNSEKIIANSRFTSGLLTGKGVADKNKIMVLTPGIDTSFFSPDAGIGHIKEEYGIPDGKKILLTVSRLAARKGHANVIKAVSGIIEEYPEVIYIIAGDGPERGRIEELSERLGIKKNVILTGDVPSGKLVYFYNLCDIFVMAPRYIESKGDVEGFGIVFMEAASCAKPVIAGKSGGVSEAVLDGETGTLVDSENPEDIRGAILELLLDGEKAAHYGTNALERAKKYFSWDDRAKALYDFL